MAIRNTIQWLAGMGAATTLIYMSYLSLQADFALRPHVIVGMLGLIVLLLYGKDPLIRLIEAWKGGSASPPVRTPDRTGDDTPTTDTSERGGSDE